MFDIEEIKNYKRILLKELNSDGHQTFVNDNVFVTDTYPDRRRMAKLYRVDINAQSKKLLAYLYHPKIFQSKLHSHICCDLHPCTSIDGKFLCFDSVFSGNARFV